MNVLLLTTVLPLRTSSGGEIVTDMLIRQLGLNGINVDVVGYLRPTDSGRSCPANYTSVETRIIETQGEKIKTALWLISSLISGDSFSSKKYTSNKYISIVKDKVKKTKYDYIIVDHTQMLWIIPWLPKEINKVFISHNVESQLYESLAKDAQNNIKKTILQREAKKMKILEDTLRLNFNQVWALSSDDLKFYSQLAGNCPMKFITFDALPVLTPPDYTQNIPSTDISILGTWTWDANMQGLRWFFNEVYPLLDKEIKIDVAGKGADWLRDKYKNVKYHGFVESAESFMLNSKLIVIPSISGAGVQIKTLDAITIGRPIIATKFALRGLTDKPSYVYEVNEPISMANLILEKISHELTLEESNQFRNDCLSWFENKEKKINAIISQNIN